MFECCCDLFLRNEMPAHRLAIMAFDRNEANVVTSTTSYRIESKTRVSMDVDAGIVRFSSQDGVYVCVMVPDERDRAVVTELLQRLCDRVEW